MLKTRPRSRNVIAARLATPAAVRPRPTVAPRGTACIGVLVDWDAKGPLVDFDGNVGGPVRAQIAAGTTRIGPSALDGKHEVVLLVDSRANRPPILLGILQPLSSIDGRFGVEARVDGRRVELEGHEEIVLRCGEASITLRRNGRILIRGVQVETRASGVNRIRGGSVAIN